MVTDAFLVELTDEQREVRELAARFSDERVAPNAARWDRDAHFPRDVVSELGELGLLAPALAPEYGGPGAGGVAAALVVEQMSRGDAGLGTTCLVHQALCRLFSRHASEDQKARIFPALATGETLAALALSEAEAGSDARALRASARGGCITGTKQWCSSGGVADWVVVFARDAECEDRISAFLVERGAPGFEVLRNEDKLGIRSSVTSDLGFEDTPAERFGDPGEGLRIVQAVLGTGRINVASQAVGLAQCALDYAVQYAKERHTFGKPIGAHQAIGHKLADMATSVEAARALVLRAAKLRAADLPHVTEASQAKLFASRVAREVTQETVQVLGGYGFSREFPAEKWYRDAKITEIYEGTSEIQRVLIARALLGDAVR